MDVRARFKQVSQRLADKQAYDDLVNDHEDYCITQMLARPNVDRRLLHLTDPVACYESLLASNIKWPNFSGLDPGIYPHDLAAAYYQLIIQVLIRFDQSFGRLSIYLDVIKSEYLPLLIDYNADITLQGFFSNDQINKDFLQYSRCSNLTVQGSMKLSQSQVKGNQLTGVSNFLYHLSHLVPTTLTNLRITAYDITQDDLIFLDCIARQQTLTIKLEKVNILTLIDVIDQLHMIEFYVGGEIRLIYANDSVIHLGLKLDSPNHYHDKQTNTLLYQRLLSNYHLRKLTLLSHEYFTRIHAITYLLKHLKKNNRITHLTLDARLIQSGYNLVCLFNTLRVNRTLRTVTINRGWTDLRDFKINLADVVRGMGVIPAAEICWQDDRWINSGLIKYKQVMFNLESLLSIRIASVRHLVDKKSTSQRKYVHEYLYAVEIEDYGKIYFAGRLDVPMRVLPPSCHTYMQNVLWQPSQHYLYWPYLRSIFEYVMLLFRTYVDHLPLELVILILQLTT